MFITRLLSRMTAILAVSISTVIAQDFRTMVTFPAGSQADAVARAMSDVLAKQTGQRLTIINMPGADTIVGTQHWRTNSWPVIFTSSGQLVANMVTRSDLPYSDMDFEHLIYVGTTPAIWIVGAHSNLRDLKDLVHAKNLMVGGYTSSYNENLHSAQRHLALHATLVNYKGAPQVLTDVVSGQIDAGLIPITPGLLNFVEQNRVRMLGSSYHKELRVQSYRIPSVSQLLNIPQFSGFIGIAVHPSVPSETREWLRRHLWMALQDPAVQQTLQTLHILPDSSQDRAWIMDHLHRLRTNMQRNTHLIR